MKFISLQDNLKKGISVVSHVTSKNINLPILNNILIKAKDNNIELLATNLEIGISHTVRGKIEKEGEFTVDSKIINDYISLLPSEKVSIEKKEEELVVECSNYKTKIKGESAKEFPLLPTINKNNYLTVSIDEFKKALSQVVFAVSSSEARIELAGILFSFENNHLTLVATDSYRLAEKQAKINKFNKTDDFSEDKIIVPARTIQEVLRAVSNLNDDLGSTEKEITIYLSENQIMFSFDSTEIISRLISGQYPDYKQIIPQKSETKVIVNRQEFVRAIKASAIFSKSGINDIHLLVDIKKNELVVSSISGQTGESVINLTGDISGKDNDITLNFRYLLDGLNNINTEKINLRIVNNNTPCLVRGDKEESYLYIVMPIRQ